MTYDYQPLTAPGRQCSDEPLSPALLRRSTVALCLSSFTVSYLFASVAPYSGFMVIRFFPKHANEENVGLLAGLLTSAFMCGRGMSAHAWGKAADTYGRVTCLSFSLTLTSLLTLAFGLSTTYPMALFWRFLLGVGNGILPIAKTAVSEIAGGNQKLEIRGMGLIMSMWGWGLLISPALSGFFAEPIRQYASMRIFQDDSSWYYGVLDAFPFCLPNVVGAVLGMMALIAVDVLVVETLTKKKVRSLKHAPSDVWSSLKRVLSSIPEEDFESDEMARMISMERRRNSKYGSTEHPDDYGSGDLADLQELFNLLQKDSDSAVHEAIIANYDESTLLLCATRSVLDGQPCSSLSTAIRRRSSIASQTKRSTALTSTSSTSSRYNPVTLPSLWNQASTRNHVIVYWASCFVISAVDEAFPLFCISRTQGPGLAETSIGKILSASGLVLLLSQSMIYTTLINLAGLYGTIRMSSLIISVIVAAIPVSLWLNEKWNVREVDGSVELAVFALLSGLMGIYRVLGLVCIASLAVALNRTVLPAHRGAVNRLATIGGSVAKALGPVFSGALVSFAFSSGAFAPQVGAVILFSALGCLGALVALLSFTLIHTDEESDANVELNI